MANPKWFDDNVYMNNKLAQLKAADADTYGSWDMYALEKAFSDAGFPGEEGAYAHFQQYGNTAAENISPNSNFIAKQYYIFKAADYYDVDVANVTSAQAAYIADAIEKAGMSAWQHYVQYGTAEGINPSNNFDTNKYLQAKADALNAQGGSTTWTAATVAKAISDAGMNALSHAIQYADGSAGEAAAPFDASGNVIDAYKVDNKAASDDTGSTFTLTTAIDVLTGTEGDDTFIGGQGTAQVADQLNGGNGTDTLQLFGGGVIPQISSIEKIYLNGTLGQDVSKYADVKTLQLDAVTTGQDFTIANGQNVIIDNMAGLTTVDISGNDVTDLTVTLNGDGTSSASKLALDLNSTKQTALTLESANKANYVTLTNTGAKIATLTVKGDQSLDVDTDNTFATATFKTVDASAATGDVTFAAGAVADAAFAYSGGSGNDTLTLFAGSVAALKAGSQLDGGAGTNDKLIVNEDIDAAALYTKLGEVKNFEVLGLGTGTANVDASKVDSFTHFSVETGAGALVITEMAKGSVVDVLAVPTSMHLTGATGAKTLTLNIGDDSTNGVQGLTGLVVDQSSVVMTSNGKAANTITDIQVASDADYTVSGDANLTLTASVGNAGAGTTGITFDAGGMKGALSLTLTHNYAATATKDIITGGSGADVLKAGAVGATLTGNDGKDTFDVSATGQSGAAVTQFSSVTDFKAGDILKFGTNVGSVDKATGIAGADDAAIFGNLAAACGNAAGDIAYFEKGGFTYVYMDVDGGKAVTMGDIAVKLTGSVDLSNAEVAADTLVCA